MRQILCIRIRILGKVHRPLCSTVFKELRSFFFHRNIRGIDQEYRQILKGDKMKKEFNIRINGHNQQFGFCFSWVFHL